MLLGVASGRPHLHFGRRISAAPTENQTVIQNMKAFFRRIRNLLRGKK